MAKKITLDIDTDGKIVADYDHFVGQECYTEAARFEAALAEFGVKTETEHVDPKRTETEVRKLEQAAGTG